MFGFFIGTACLLGLAAVARHNHRYRHGHFGHHHRGGFGRRFGGRFFLHRVLDRLDTTPGHEKVIRDAIHDLKDQAWGFRRELRGTRTQLADALRGPELDKAVIDRVFAEHDEVIEKLRASLVDAAGKVHGTLDERQRERLANLLEAGPWAYAGC